MPRKMRVLLPTGDNEHATRFASGGGTGRGWLLLLGRRACLGGGLAWVAGLLGRRAFRCDRCQHCVPRTQYPGLSTQDSVPRTQYPGLSTQDSVPRTQYPVPRTQYPGLSTQDSVPRTQYPGLRTQDSGLRTQDSGLRTQDSGLTPLTSRLPASTPVSCETDLVSPE
ncbi:hypothetical protein TBK1r_16910 [Stieleria magnilauensis]|uniref:Uncharacterized protein n=1 Tax=Stieleria magnilauensis TaxID=2527963 RepID=A0ABX5XLJ9_9BACT|nr:hypothetical protein TBK1r_16910 [Planctomycetes bacterium TBK1r]